MQLVLNGISLNLCSLKVVLDALPLFLKVTNLTSSLSYTLQQEPLLVIESCDIFFGCIDLVPLGFEEFMSGGKLSLQVIPDALDCLKLAHVSFFDQEHFVAMFVFN